MERVTEQLLAAQSVFYASVMKILFLNSSREWGGNEKWSLLAAEGLATRGHRVFFGCRSPMFRERAGGSPPVFVRFPFANQGDLLSVLLIALFIRRNRIDAVIPTRQREYLLGGLAAMTDRRVRVVARLGIDRTLRTARSRFAFTRLFDGLIVNAQSIVTTLGKTPGFDTSICRVIYNGITVPAVLPETRTRVRRDLGFSNDIFLIVCAGRCSPQKGFDLAIESFAALSPDRPDARLLIAGDGQYADEYKSLARTLDIAEKAVFTGFRNDLPDLLQAADLFWLTSRSEGMPNVVLEAMAAGVPAVAFDVAGVSELIDNGTDGLIVAQGDLRGLVAATLDLMRDGRRREAMGTAARTTVQKSYTLEKMVENVEVYLKDICNGKSGRDI